MGARIAILAMLVLAMTVLSGGPSAGQEPILALLTGPAAVAPGAVGFYNVTILGGPTGRVNYTIQWHVTGTDLTGALPTPTAPSTRSGNTTRILINITAPIKEQTITLVVTVSAAGATSEDTTAERSIVVITPLVLSATFRNASPTAALNVSVRFFVDDALAGTQRIARIDAGGEATATYGYLPVGLVPGAHRVRVEADLDHNGVIEQSRGEVVASDLFYRGTPALSTGWTVLIGIGIFVPVFLVTVAMRRRQRS